MDSKKMCNLFREADGYFNDENVDTKKINKNTKIKGYCSNNGCKTNEDYINALSAYIYKEFKNLIKRNQKHNDYDEYLLMWISDKLLKIHKKGKGKKIGIGRMDDFTLKRAYEEYLKNHRQRLDYWSLLDMNPGLKEANLWYMSGFYKLLNLICKIITGYYNGPKNKQFYKYPADCSHQYKNLYLNISECKPYLDLLNKLKGIYDDFSSVIKKYNPNSELATKLKKLTPENGKEMDAVRGYKTYDFSTEQCKFPKKKKTKPKKQDKSPLQLSNQLKGRQQETPPAQKPAPPSPQEPQPETQQLSSTTPLEEPPAKLGLPSSSLQESQNPGTSHQSGKKDSGNVPDASKSGQNVSDGVQVNQVTHSKQGSPSSETGNEDTKKGGVRSETGNPGGGQDNQGGSGSRSGGESGSEQGSQGGSGSGSGGESGSEQGSQGGSGGSYSDQHNSSIEIKEQGNGTVDKPKQSQDGQQEISNPKHGNSIDGSENSDVSENRGKMPSTTELEKQQSQSESKKGTELKNNQTEGSSHPNGHVASKIESKDSESSKSNTGGASGDTRSSSTGSDNLGDGSSDQDSGSDAREKKDLQIDPSDPSSQPLTSDTNKEGLNSEPGSTDKNPLNGGGEQGGQDDQKSQDGSGSESRPGNEQNPKDSDTGEKGPKNTSGTSFDFKPYIFRITLKGIEQLSNAFEFFEEKREQLKKVTDTIKNIYNTSVSNIQNGFYKSIEFFNGIINSINIDFKQVEKTPDSGNNQSGPGATGGGSPAPDGPSPPPKDSNKQDSHQTSPTPPTTENSKEQTQVQKSSQDPSGNQNSDQTNHEGTQKSVSVSATKEKNPGTELKVNGMTEIGDSYVLKEYKKIVILIIVILIPITLTIMYKYLSFGRRNELKKKNNMKKVINMVGVNKTTKTVINSSDGKKQIQIIIKSYSQKKKTKKFINFVYGEKSPSLNIYQLMQADPVPFINLIFLLIFFVYKRKRDFIE
ncbi:CIR protein [Plasmodium chabaudi chabaudi]|uniref:CIR protein n=1 Tax=Plasmodium chabaudi chabaudi TaxID=31271 RepID=A0A4V0K6Q1_PLACU|nr:CIR protein [Plasmodium chabaudi chabaudi]VTZ68591.1 CIR protein [Plasmodium chabaudi chabaudi]|eukprot:XP_016652894.1 CIR protein [Plasmodium chabaudi chabaudi]